MEKSNELSENSLVIASVSNNCVYLCACSCVCKEVQMHTLACGS